MNTIRDYTTFTDFGGSIVNGVYEYPVLLKKDAKDKIRLWKVYVRLVKETSQTKRPDHKIGWDLLAENQIPIKSVYLDSTDIPKGTIAQVWYESGIKDMKISRHAPTYVEANNVGKSNERNALKHAMIIARNKYLKKKNEGGNTTGDSVVIAGKYYPMLARKWTDDKDRAKIIYPCYVQAKLDGMRCVAFYNPGTKKVELYSRNLKDITGFDHLKAELEPYLKKYKCYLDGEFYKHGKRLQEITGEVRSLEKNNTPTDDSVKFWIFDCFYPDNLKLTYGERIKILDEIFATRGAVFKWSISVPIHKVKNEKECDQLYKDYLKKKYEGVMVKNIDGLYKTGTTSGSTLRSSDVLKRKMEYEEEYEIVGFKEGEKGEARGLIIWELKTTKGKVFTSVPIGISNEERHKLYLDAQANFDKKYCGRQAIIKFQDLSADGKPLRAKMVGFRDYE